MFWQDNYFSSSFFKKNINSNSRFSYVNSDYAKTSEQKYSAGNKCFEKSSDSSSYETFVDYSEGANILEQMSWSKLCSDFFNTFFANRNVVSDSTDQASTDNSYGSGTNDGIMTLAMLEEGGSSLDGQISTKAMYEEGGSDSIGGSTGDDTSGETNLNDGIMTLAMLEDGGSSLDGQISTKAMYEEGGSDSDKPSLGDKPFWGHHHWGHHHWGGGAVTLAMLEDGGSSLDGQISTKAMYEEGGSDSDRPSWGDKPDCDKPSWGDKPDCDKPSWGDKPFWGHHHWGHHHWGGGAVTLAMLECGGSAGDDGNITATRCEDGGQDVTPPSCGDDNVDVPSVDDDNNNEDTPSVDDDNNNDGGCDEQPEVDKPQDDFPELTLPDDNDFGSINATTFIAYEDGGQ